MEAALENFGKYHVLSRIAQGGMAEIYKVKTVGIAGFEKVQALKRIRPHFAREPRFIRSFKDEARIAVELSHRNIVQVFDFVQSGDDLYLAMELIDGIDLRTAIKDAKKRSVKVPIPIACYILGEIGAGLEYAHRKSDSQGESLGIVHCDVSPPNVMLSYEGYVKILDFGVARASFSAQQHTRRLRGKPRYMAPEQTHGDTPTPATDVFALGIIAWELLTGLPLFEGRDLHAILQAVRRADAPAVDRLNPDVPAVVAETVSRALTLDPTDRGSAGDFAIVMQRTAQLFSPRANARSLSYWLQRVYPELNENGGLAAEPDPQTPGWLQPTATIDPESGSPGGSFGHSPTERDLERERETTFHERERAPRISNGEGNAGSEGRSTAEPASADQPARAALDTGPTRTLTLLTGMDLVDSVEEELALPGLREKRRVVAAAVVIDGGSDEARRELALMLGHLAYKRGAVVHSQDERGLIAVFGLEVAGEDDVASAMTYALDAAETARGANAAGEVDLTIRIAARAGIVAAPDTRGGYRLVGDAVEETRELARGAEPGRPLLSGGAGRLTSAHYAFRELPARRHRHRRRVRVLELMGPRSFDERTRALHSRRGRFFGRHREILELSSALDRAREGKRQVTVAVIGPSGVGKSRLIAEFVARASVASSPGEGLELVAVTATPGSKMAPFSLLVELVQAIGNLPPGRGEAARSQLTRRMRHVLSRHDLDASDIDEVVAALELAMELRDGARLATPRASADLRERLTGAMHALRSALAPPNRPLIWVIEDLHFADASSLEILQRARPIGNDQPELTIVSSHHEDSISKRLADWVEQLISVGELSGDDLCQLIRDRLGATADDAAISAIAERAGGNPLLVEQLALEARDAGEIPPTARALITARVDRLSPAAKAVLQHAAVAGARFRTRILEELLDREITDEFEELCGEAILLRHGGGAAAGHEAALAFATGLIREVVYESLSAGARRDTHLRLGEILAARYRAGRDEPPATIAEHFERGDRLSAASAFWLRAGKLDLAAGDASAAIERFSRTLAIEDQREDEARSQASQARLREAVAGRELAYRQLGDHEAQKRDLERLEKLARGNPELMADVKNRTAIRLLRLGDYQAAIAVSEDAEKVAQESCDQLSQGEALRIRGEVYERIGDLERSLAVTRSASEIFHSIEASGEETKALIGIGRTHVVQSRYAEALAEYEAIAQRVRQNGDPWLERIILNHVSVIHLCLGEFEKAMESIDRAIAICQRYGDHPREGDCLSVGGTVLLQVGCYRDAQRYFCRALDILESTDSRWSRADCLLYAGAAEIRLGNFDRGMAYLDDSIRQADAIGARYVQANALLAISEAHLARGGTGDAERARKSATRAVAIAREATLIGCEIQGLSRQAEATSRIGKLETALELSSRAIELLDGQPNIEGSEEEVLYTHYRLLRAASDSSADIFLSRAKKGIERKLEAMSRPDWRRAFTEDVPVNAAILRE